MPRRSADRLAAGRRDWFVTIEQRSATDTPDASSGEPAETWTELISGMPAAREDAKGTERFAANQMSAPFDARWEINYRADMDPALVDVPELRRLVYENRVHDIVAASEMGRRRGIELWTLASSGL